MRWSILLPTGEYLDTPPDFSLQFELNNLVFSTSDTSNLQGSFSFPVDVPLTKRMKEQLGFPHRIDIMNRSLSIDGVKAIAGGVELFVGTMSISNVSNSSARMTLVAKPLDTLKTKKLHELDFEGPRVIVHSSWPEFMKDTADLPEDYDFAFFYVSDDANGTHAGFNLWDNVAEEFLLDNSLATPFVRLDYLLRRMLSETGYSFSNEFQNTVELGRLYVFNNADARVLSETTHEPELQFSFELNKHLPPISCAEFLKKLMAQWNLGIFSNIFEKRISIIPLKTVLQRAAKFDWTEYALNDLEIISDEKTKAPGYYNYAQPNAIPSYVPPVEDAELINTAKDVDDALPLDPGYYYVETNSNYIKVTDGLFGERQALCHRGVRIGDGDDYGAGMEALFDFLDQNTWSGPLSTWVDDGGYRWEQTDFPIALMFYRGLQDCIIGANRSTLCGNSVWLDGVGAPGGKAKIVTGGTDVAEATLSLNWFGPYGLYENYHKVWANTIRNGTHGEQSFIMPLSMIKQFSFADKIRVGNMDYFIKKLRIQKLLDRGRVLVRASFVTVI